MSLIYNLGILFYGFFIRVAALFNKKAKLFVAGRKNWKAQLRSAVDKNASYIWFHCASLGEFEQGRPVLEEIKKQYPNYKIILTFFSPSGYEIRKNYEGADIVSYLPMDTKTNAQDFIRLVRPKKVFFVKYEFWYNYITELKTQEIPLYIISAIFRETQQFFKSTPGENGTKKYYTVSSTFLYRTKPQPNFLNRSALNISPFQAIPVSIAWQKLPEVQKNLRLWKSLREKT
ncbi:3-deoxy-D-manno-octulosonic acid transferase [Draconibacterium halophilum]|uniref:3-deoxy-D-manno-octulosonic acid transferase n=1 Tax=Draconibacterium halophilum TaxID=2706887 RepID=UPI00193EFA2E|nr:glycosyltransferase N-terminal domain-containing protein [Draconibacterium halophilum]